MSNERNEELLKLLKTALTVDSDEMEGQQTVDFSSIDACSIDSGLVRTPILTPEQIISMLHLNDPNLGFQETSGAEPGYSDIMLPSDVDMNALV